MTQTALKIYFKLILTSKSFTLIFIMKVSTGLGYVISCSVHYMPPLIFYGPEMCVEALLVSVLMLVTHELLSIHSFSLENWMFRDDPLPFRASLTLKIFSLVSCISVLLTSLFRIRIRNSYETAEGA